MHAAQVVRAAAAAFPGATFYGLTGPRTRAAGVETIFDLTTHAAMLSGIINVIGQARRALRLIKENWDKRPPDLVLLVDSPELHLRVARLAHRRKLRVLYYVAPQTWASRPGRNRQIARDVDRLACILPFEEDYFRRNLVYADYVGHPLFETLQDEIPRDEAVRKLRASGRPVVAIMPGSRRHVIDTMLPLQLQVIRRLRAQIGGLTSAISCISADRIPQIRRHMHASGFASEIIVDDNASLLTAADLVLVASGTATLHVAHYRKPMVVMYDAGRLLALPYRLFGRFIIKLPHLSLVNILADARVVPEFMPFIRDLDAIAAVAGQLLGDETRRQIMIRQLDEIVSPLEGTQASANVCRIMRDLLAS